MTMPDTPPLGEIYFRALFEACGESLIVANAEARAIDCNEAALRLHGCQRSDLLGTTPLDWSPEWQADGRRSEEWAAEILLRVAAGEIVRFEWENFRLDGTPFFVSVTVRSVLIDEQIYYLVVSRDISDTLMLRRKLIASEQRLSQTLSHAPNVAVQWYDLEGRVRYWNQASERLYGYSADQALGKTLDQLIHTLEDAAAFQQTLAHILASGETIGPDEFVTHDCHGVEKIVLATIFPIPGESQDESFFVCMDVDISPLKEQERQLHQLAHHDPLTGLPNRSLLQDRIRQGMAQALRHDRRMALILLDLDGFKWINDSVGHETGDAVLVIIAQRLASVVRAQDTVARLGGDEFVLLIQDVSGEEDVLLIADKALGRLREPIELQKRAYHVSGSVGITLFPDDGTDEHALIRNADIAMYQAKAAGKNRSQFYSSNMQRQALQHMEMVSGLRHALQAHEFVLHYQPVVDAQSGRLLGAEALIRWQHLELGLIPPLEFIPVAEESGLIVPIGAWALREALRQMQAWDRDGVALPRVAVNFSALQFREPDLSDMARQVLQEFDMASDRLTVEITESVLMDDNHATGLTINSLDGLGVFLSLDDFGTGYSSLSALKRFPVDCVKIDRSFVRDCVQDLDDGNLVKAIIQMAHSLNLTVVAEGVETTEQAAFLQQHGCDQLQGYLISKPLPADAFMAFIRNCQTLSN